MEPKGGTVRWRCGTKSTGSEQVQRYLKEPIGVFDSGVGGLSVLKELERELPNEHYIYYGDTKNLPYGSKTPEQIIELGKTTVNFFKALGVKNVVMACNTSSALAYDALREEFGDIKIFPIIQNVAKDLAQYEKIGVMATLGTVKSRKYTQEILKVNPNAQVFESACENFVQIVENRQYEQEKSVEYIKNKLGEVLYLGVKKIVLGCTHYPYLMPILTKWVPQELFIDPAEIFVQNVVSEIKNSNKPFEGTAKKEFYVSGDVEDFKKSAMVFRDTIDLEDVRECSTAKALY